MFETLFTYPAVLARHQTGPGSAERGRYLAHCAGRGLARETLLRIARELLVVAERLDVTVGHQITRLEIEAAAGRWVRHQRRRRRGGRGDWSRQLFIQIAIDWLSFLELLAVSPAGKPNVHFGQIDDFIAHLRDERGLSPCTVSHRRWHVERFLRHVSSARASIADIAVDDVDAFLDSRGRDGWCRVSIATSAAALRSFFRHAEMRGWCSLGIAAAIDAPRLFKQDGLPRGPRWVDVQRLLEGTVGEGPRDTRDHAILMLLAIYGLRSGEVRGLRLEDLDWTREVITVRRPKQRRIQYYPLVASVGDAILRYLQAARPRCTFREVFVTLKAPFRPLSAGGVYYAVASRLNALGIQAEHHGPHSGLSRRNRPGHPLLGAQAFRDQRLLRFAIARGHIDRSPLPRIVPQPLKAFVPHIYSHEELRRLLDAVAVSDHPRCRIDPSTHRTLLLLLYGAGLRISEARALTLADVDLDSGLLCIRESKFYKTRLVPICADLIRILTSHAAGRRQQHAEPAAAFFVSRKGDAVTRQNAEMAFCRLRIRADVLDETAAARHQPRLHDLRHSFAVHRLITWYRDGADVQRLLPQLSTYLGHVHISGTQHYLTLTPELLREAGLRFERYAMGSSHD